jgi:dihydrofolate synthase/folylpolyglutamate synthase
MTSEQATALVESREIFGMRFGLERMRHVLDALGRPHLAAPAIHVVGTNGKSSTARFAAAVLSRQIGSAGCYVSPHVADWHERIMIDGIPISPERFAQAIGWVVDAEAGALDGSGERLTQFELLTVAAFAAFADCGVGAMVVEAGLGGRFDATNVFDGARCVALTGIALDHTELLGDTEWKIAAEKLAVCPDGYSRLVVGPLGPLADGAVREVCRARDLQGWFIGSEVGLAELPDGTFSVTTPGGRYTGLSLGVHGGFQRANAALGLAAAERLVGHGLDVAAARGALGLVRVPGRLEVLAGAPDIVLDGAHNPDGMRALARALDELRCGRPCVAVVGVFADKDIDAMSRELAGVCERAVATSATAVRAARADRVAGALRVAGIMTVIEPDATRAVERARELAGPRGLVVVCGSLALLGDVRSAFARAGSGDPGMLAGGKLPEMVDKPER